MTIARCARAACTFVTIIDDVTVEHMEELFAVNIVTNSSLTNRIKFEKTQAVVTITDDDGMFISVECLHSHQCTSAGLSL